jgi:hypothetical protein
MYDWNFAILNNVRIYGLKCHKFKDFNDYLKAVDFIRLYYVIESFDFFSYFSKS